jgi:hypothetical protein
VEDPIRSTVDPSSGNQISGVVWPDVANVRPKSVEYHKEPPDTANITSLPDAEMAPADHDADPSRAGRPCADPRADHVTPESEDIHSDPVPSDTTI